MDLRVHMTRLSRAPMGGEAILRRLLGMQHKELNRSGQPWIQVSGLTPGQCAGYRGLFRSRNLPATMFQIVGTPEELGAVEEITRDVEAAA